MVGQVIRAIVYTLASASPDTVASQHENIRPASSGPGTPTPLTQDSSPDSVLATERLLRTGGLGVGQDGGRLRSQQGEDLGSEAVEDESMDDSAEEFDLDSSDDGFMLPPPQLDLDCDDSSMPLPRLSVSEDLLLPVSPPQDLGRNEALRCATRRAGKNAVCSTTVRTSPSFESSFSLPRGIVENLGDELFATKVLPYLALVDVSAALSCGRGISRHAMELFWQELLQDRFAADSALVQVALRLLVASRTHAPALCSLVSVVSEGLQVLQSSHKLVAPPPQPALVPASTVSSRSSAETVFLDDGFALPPPALPSAPGSPPLFSPSPTEAADLHDLLDSLEFQDGSSRERTSPGALAVLIPAVVCQGTTDVPLLMQGDGIAAALDCDQGPNPSNAPQVPPPSQPSPPPHSSQPRAARMPQPAAWAAGQRRRAARRGVRRRPTAPQRPRAHTLLPAILDGVAFGGCPKPGSTGGLPPRTPAGRGKWAAARGSRRGGGKWWNAGCHGPVPATA